MAQQTQVAGEVPGRRLLYGETVNDLLDCKLSLDSGITALGTNLATAYQIQCAINHFSTVAASTGCKLPSALTLQKTKSPNANLLNILGKQVEIFNYGASTLAIYAPDGSTIDGIAGATGTTLSAANRSAIFSAIAVNTTTGAVTWVSVLGGAVSS